MTFWSGGKILSRAEPDIVIDKIEVTGINDKQAGYVKKNCEAES
jgi:hypothetical protein